MYWVGNMLKVLLGYGAAVLATYAVGVLLISQANLSNVVAMGATVDASIRLEVVWHDLLHMYEIYLPLVAVSFVIALPVAALVIRWQPNLRLVGYVLAGFFGLVAIHVIMKAVLGLSGVAPTRTIMGLLAQGFAGAVGGYLFHRITRLSRAPNKLDA
ncbi:MAG: hypothetical protein ACJAWK_000380 [Candidatus Azotimanducaceae bacterium]